MDKILSDLPDVVSVSDLMEVLHIGKNTAYLLLRNNIIKSIRIGRIYKIPKIFIKEYLQSEITKANIE